MVLRPHRRTGGNGGGEEGGDYILRPAQGEATLGQEGERCSTVGASISARIEP
jgi:hypothetical protein